MKKCVTHTKTEKQTRQIRVSRMKYLTVTIAHLLNFSKFSDKESEAQKA